MVIESLKLMLLGMSFVILFLTLLMVCMMLMGGWFKSRALVPAITGRIDNIDGELQDSELIAVISAAIQAHRRN